MQITCHRCDKAASRHRGWNQEVHPVPWISPTLSQYSFMDFTQTVITFTHFQSYPSNPLIMHLKSLSPGLNARRPHSMPGLEKKTTAPISYDIAPWLKNKS